MTPRTIAATSVPFRPALTAMIRSEARLVARDTAGLMIPLALPLLIMVMNQLGVDRTTASAAEIATFTAKIIPVTLGLVLTMIGVVNMPSFIATYRTTGVLRRLAVTPAHPGLVLTAQGVVSLVHAAIGIAIALLLAFVAFDAPRPVSVGWVVVALILGVAALYGIGMLIAAMAPSANAAIAIGMLAFFSMMALGGAFGPRDNLPGVLATIGEFSPYGALVESLGVAWLGGTPQTTHLAAMAICAVVASAVAWRAFRWD